MLNLEQCRHLLLNKHNHSTIVRFLLLANTSVFIAVAQLFSKASNISVIIHIWLIAVTCFCLSMVGRTFATG